MNECHKCSIETDETSVTTTVWDFLHVIHYLKCKRRQDQWEHVITTATAHCPSTIFISWVLIDVLISGNGTIMTICDHFTLQQGKSWIKDIFFVVLMISKMWLCCFFLFFCFQPWSSAAGTDLLMLFLQQNIFYHLD